PRAPSRRGKAGGVSPTPWGGRGGAGGGGGLGGPPPPLGAGGRAGGAGGASRAAAGRGRVRARPRARGRGVAGCARGGRGGARRGVRVGGAAGGGRGWRRQGGDDAGAAITVHIARPHREGGDDMTVVAHHREAVAVARDLAALLPVVVLDLPLLAPEAVLER